MPNIFKNVVKRSLLTNKKRNFVFIFLFVLFFCLLIFNFSDIISSILTNSKSIFIKNRIEVPSYSVYAISIANSNDKNELEVISKKVKSMGGAGIIDANQVLLSLYPTLSQAKEICENLKEIGNDQCEIVCFKTDYIIKNYNGNNTSEITNGLKLFRNIIENLFEISINFDKKIFTIQQTKNEIVKILSCTLSTSLKIKDNCKDEDLKNMLVESYNKEKDLLYKLINFNSKISSNFSSELEEDLFFSSLLKQSYFETLFLNILLSKQVNCL